MIDIIEKSFNINIHNIVQVRFLHKRICLCDSVFCRPVRSKPIASVADFSFTDRFEDLQNTLLLTNYEGLDPEMEQNASPLPIPFTVVLGVDITF